MRYGLTMRWGPSRESVTEAFAARALGVTREMGPGFERVNVNGSGI